MLGTLGPDVARAAVALHRSHPHRSVLDVLDAVMHRRSGSLEHFGDAIHPDSEFGALLAKAFDLGPTPTDWSVVHSPTAGLELVAAMRRAWRSEVLPRFAARYSLEP
jgi:hypothetical protein